MDRPKEIELLAQCLDLAEQKRPYVTDDEARIPVERYIDSDRFDRERQLLRTQMNIVGHGAEIPSPGDFITRDVLGTPTLLVRQDDGSIKAFLNVCRHRGATVALSDRGSCRRFVCPYHAWTYERDGALAAVRQREGFPSLDVERTSLVELPAAEAAGLLWVCPEVDGARWEPDAPTLQVLAELEWLGCAASAVFASKSRIWEANWKLIVDGGLESYHFKIAHRNTIASFFTDNTSTFELIGDHIRSILPRTSMLALRDRPQSEWDLRQHSHMLYAIAPNASILVQERHLELILMTPVAVDRTRLDILTVVPDPGDDGLSDKARSFYAANHAFTNTTLDEDFEIAEQIQRGIATGANTHFRFATFEGALTQWHRRFEEKLSGPLDQTAG